MQSFKGGHADTSQCPEFPNTFSKKRKIQSIFPKRWMVQALVKGNGVPPLTSVVPLTISA